MLDGVVFTQHIDLLGVGEKRNDSSPLSGEVAGRGQVGVCGPPQLAFFRCTIRYCRCIPTAPLAVDAKGTLLSRAGLAVSIALLSSCGHSIPIGRRCRDGEGQHPQTEDRTEKHGFPVPEWPTFDGPWRQQ